MGTAPNVSSSSATYRVNRSPPSQTAFSPAQTPISKVQNASDARVSCVPAGVLKPSRANSPMAPITRAVVTSMIADSPSARRAMPSGGVQPPTR